MLRLILFLLSFNLGMSANPKGFSDVAKRVMPSSVNIVVLADNSNLESIFGDSFVRKFFSLPEDIDLKKIPMGNGSGFIISEDGYVVTNRHVVDKADEVSIKLSDGKEYRADVIYLAEGLDVAILKIDSNDKFKALPLGDSRSVEPGEYAIAFGSPYGFSNSMTLGIVSATERNVNDLVINGLPALIQTDATINMGNSGGPLTNVLGEVIGINSVLVKNNSDQIGTGIGFAIPIDLIKPMAKYIIKNGKFDRGYMGISVNRRKMKQGVEVGFVFNNSPAHKVGLEKGDVILQVNERVIEHPSHIISYVGTLPVGERVLLKIQRGSNFREISFILEKNIDGMNKLNAFNSTFSDINVSKENMSNKKGIIVSEVNPKSKLYSKGVWPGDVLVAVDDIEINSLEELANAYNGIRSGSKVILTFMRDNNLFRVIVFK